MVAKYIVHMHITDDLKVYWLHVCSYLFHQELKYLSYELEILYT